MQGYVLGFLFNEQSDKVLLIEKKRPSWQAGYLNGVGGKIESQELAIEAMVREFREEAVKEITDWSLFATLEGDGFNISCYKSYGDLESIKKMNDEKTKLPTDEELFIHKVEDITLGKLKCIPNLAWLVNMALYCSLEAEFDYLKVVYATNSSR